MAAATAQYEEQPLFPYDASLMRPLMVCLVQSTEFLLVLVTPQQIGLGMFVNAKGDAVRGNLRMSSFFSLEKFSFFVEYLY
jgi:hypothetical protein